MASQTRLPLNVSRAAVTPYDDEDWSQTSRLSEDDGSYAYITASTFDNGDYSRLVSPANFGFSIPTGTIITGIELTFEGYYATSQFAIAYAQLRNVAGSVAKTPGTLITSTSSSSPSVVTVGGPTDLWGLSSIALAAVNSNTYFGFDFAIQAKGNNCDAYLDYVSATVYYSPPPTPQSVGGATITPTGSLSTVHTQVGYHIERKTGSDGTWEEIAVDPASPYQDDGPTGGFVGGTTYYYRIRQFSAGQYGDYSNEKSITFVPQGSSEATVRVYARGSGGPGDSAVQYVTTGGGFSGVGSLTPSLPALRQPGDLCMLFVESANEAISISSNGSIEWTEVTNSPQYTGSAASAGGVRLAVYYGFWSSGTTGPTIADSGDHTFAIIAVFRNVDPSTPFDAAPVGGVDAIATTAISCPAITTVTDGAMVVNAIGLDQDSTATNDDDPSCANSALTFLRRRIYRHTSDGVGGGIGIYTGIKYPAGNSGNTTATKTGTGALSTTAYLTMALRPYLPTPQDGSEATVVISPQGSGLRIFQGDSEAIVVISPQGSGSRISQGDSEATVFISPQGSGLSIFQGASEAEVVISPQGSGSRISQGDSEATVVVSAQGSGSRISQGDSEAEVVISPQGSGSRISQGDSEATVVVSLQGSGLRISQGDSEATVVVSAQGSGEVITQILSGSSSATVVVGGSGSGMKVVSGDSESTVLISVDAQGLRIGVGDSEVSVLITASGSGVLIAQGSSNASVVISAEGLFEKAVSGSSEATVVIIPQGSGSNAQLTYHMWVKVDGALRPVPSVYCGVTTPSP